MVSATSIRLCLEDPFCVGWSNRRNRLYYTKYPTYVVDAEVYILNSNFRRNLMGGVPIGGYTNGELIMGTLTWFAVDNNGNYYGITDAHVVAGYDVVYFPSPLLLVNPSLTAEHIPIISPTPIGKVIYRSDLSSPSIQLDMAVFTLNVKPVLISYGKILPWFFNVPHEGEPVIKVGARTGLSNGTVLDSSATIKIYEVTGLKLFTGPLFVLHSQEGDSGGPIFVGTSIVSSIVAGTGVYAVGNDPILMLQTLHSLGLKPAFNPGLVGVLTAAPFIIGGSILAFLSKFI